MSNALIEYGDASPEVRAVYDDIMATRHTDWINNFWKAAGARSRHAKAHLGIHQADHGARRARCANQGDDLRGRQRHQPVRLLHRLAHRLGAQQGHDARRCFTS